MKNILQCKDITGIGIRDLYNNTLVFFFFLFILIKLAYIYILQHYSY